jgi:hypothetical protein
MDSAIDFMEKPDDRFVNPDSLAWDLVMGDDREDFSGIMEGIVTDGEGSYRANRYEQLEGEFQILLTIYMEMVFHVLKSNYMGELLDENGDIRDGVDLEAELERYRPDFRKYSVEDMTEIFRTKFAKIRYFLSVRDLTDLCSDDPADFGRETEYYCKILLLDDRRSLTRRYFQKATHIPDGKRYTFLMRPDDDPQQKKLDDFYTVVYLPPHVDDKSDRPRKVRISFSKYNVISKDPHTAI